MEQKISPDTTDDPAQLSAESAAEVERLLTALRRESGARKLDGRILLRPVLVTAMVEALLCLVIQYYRWHGGSPEIAHLLARWNLLLLIPAVCGSYVYSLWKAYISARPNKQLTPIQLQIKASLNELNDVRAIGPLVDARYATEPLREIVFTSLMRLLSKMDTEKAASILRPYANKLYSLLDSEMAASHPDLMIAILRHLPPLADPMGLICTARFIVRDAPTHNEQRVREAAREALPQLLAHVDLGKPTLISNWIQRLPLMVQDQLSYIREEVLMPHLAIMKLLPQMMPTDYLMLSPKERQRLYTNLKSMEIPRLKADYALIVLEMIHRSGDVEALPTVKELVTGSIYGSPYPAVREAARNCVPILTAQLEKEKVSKTLLRGASAPEVAPDTLLRAASGSNAADPQLLLRAGARTGNGSDYGSDC